jgi:myo-inositol-1(or 4)-monophosphatase
VPSSNPSATHCLWSRILRNAATLARLRVLECLKQSTSRDIIGIGAGGDPTRRFDAVAEQAMVGYVEQFTAFTLLSEEAGMKQVGSSPKGFLIMDPIDGSANLSRDISFACIAIAYASELVFDAIECAVVVDLFSGKCYHASRGGGAFRDRQSICPSKETPLEMSVVGIDARFPPKAIKRNPKEIDRPSIRYTRHFGANALELCFVADGSLDGFIDLRGVFRGTDLAAASLILKEAGVALIDQYGAAIKGRCTNDARYAYIAARDESCAKTLLNLASEK